MRFLKYILFSLLFSINVNAQVIPVDSLAQPIDTEENDTIISDVILLEEVVVSNVKLDYESKKKFLILQKRVYRVYPYARMASIKLVELNRNMAKLKTNKEKKKYFKLVEDYLENEFKGQLKKLSRQQGQILVKLIHRQTGLTTFDLIKDYKSGWKAFWSNNTAKLFNISLKEKYLPYEVNEDYLIETILYRAFNSGRLVEQPAAEPIDFYDLSDYWDNKAIEAAKK
jgi:hypothetical protein